MAPENDIEIGGGGVENGSVPAPAPPSPSPTTTTSPTTSTPTPTMTTTTTIEITPAEMPETTIATIAIPTMTTTMMTMDNNNDATETPPQTMPMTEDQTEPGTETETETETQTATATGTVQGTEGETAMPEKETETMTKATAIDLSANLVSNGENNGNAPNQQQQQTPHTQTESAKGKMDTDAALANFKVLYVVTQLVGLTMIILVGSWIAVHMGGLSGTSDPAIEFNWHPLLMTIGLIFLYGNSILVYRGFRTARKQALKIAHASVHMGAFILTVIALKTVFDSHNLAKNPIPNMYSLHSWLGLSAVILFCMQYVAGFMAYLVPGLKESYKIAYMPLHIYFGLFGFVLAIASALMGLTEKALFSNLYPDLPSSGVMANICGVMFVLFGGLVVYLATEPSYKRKAVPENAVLLTGASE